MGIQQTPEDSNRFQQIPTDSINLLLHINMWNPRESIDSMDVHGLPNSSCYEKCVWNPWNPLESNGIHWNPMDSYRFHAIFFITIWSSSHAWIPWNSMEFQSPFGFQADVCGTVKYCHYHRLPHLINMSTYTPHALICSYTLSHPLTQSLRLSHLFDTLL